MAVEKKRQCGYRKVGALYLVNNGPGITCDRLPFTLSTCPICGQGVKQARGWTWVRPPEFLEGDHNIALGQVVELCEESRCAICRPSIMGTRAGLMWVGSKYYTPISFQYEAHQMGISKRIPAIPTGIQLGKTWVLLAHPDSVNERDITLRDPHTITGAVFTAFIPTRIEMLVTQSQYDDDFRRLMLGKRGITAVPVPDDDPHHNPPS